MKLFLSTYWKTFSTLWIAGWFGGLIYWHSNTADYKGKHLATAFVAFLAIVVYFLLYLWTRNNRKSNA